jgi:hypothetical protein
MPRNVKRCKGCRKRQDKDKGQKYAVSESEYLCQACYDSHRDADEVLPLCLNAGLLSTALFPL